MDLCSLLERQKLAIDLARSASILINQTSGHIKSIDQKDSFADLVTETDKAVEKLIFEELKKQYPNDKFIGEESASKNEWTNDPTWIIDPIDGTTNFIHTFPFSCISIGFTVNKKPCIGVVYNPSLDHLYTGLLGHGAKLFKSNGEIIDLQVRPCASLNQALIMTEFGGQRDNAKKEAVFKNIEAVGWNCHGVRSMGSAALNICYVASGYSDAYYEFGIHIWDICAAVVILNEAKGYACDTQGGPLDMQRRRILVASSENIAKDLSKALPIHLELEKD